MWVTENKCPSFACVFGKAFATLRFFLGFVLLLNGWPMEIELN